ncbi:MAG: PAS domain-containing protein [Sphingobacteriales bacterium JAD_PAG50586_3]|nr:MAG: PAS domain-containing protein [Sphingobacteriales bacterium JAD_PAG50586_3]
MNAIQYDKEDILALITQGIDAGVWDWNVDTGKAWWSDGYYRLLGYQQGDVEPSFGTFADGLVHPDDRDAVQTAVTNHINFNVPYELEIRLKTKNEGYKWFETSGSAKLDESGRTTRMSGVIINRHNKISLRRKLELSEFLLNETGRIASIAGWELVIETGEFYMTKAGYEVYGHEEGKPITAEDREKMFSPEDWKERNEKLQETIKTGKEYESVNQITLRDGTKKWIHNKVVPIYGDNGMVTMLRGVTQDITEQKQHEEDMRSTYATIEEQNRRLLNFAHIVTHNLRAHSGNLIKVSEILESTDSDLERMEMTSFVKRLSLSLHETINNLNEIVQIQTRQGLKKRCWSLIRFTLKY